MSDTTMFQRPNLQDLVKEAMEGTVQRVDINLEAARQLHKLGAAPPMKKEAAAAPQMTPTSYITKLAGALSYLSKQAAEGTAEIQPGKGPGALEVMQATSSEENIDAGQSGQAVSQNVPPKNPPMQSSGVAKDPPNAMQTNDEMMHGEQPVDPMGNEKTSAIYRRNLQKLGFSVTQEGHGVDARVLRMREQAALQRTKQLQDEGIQGYKNLTGDTVPGSYRKALTTPVGAILSEDPRHLAYAAARHEAGGNAWNPFGGILTPHPMEEGGTALGLGKIKGTKAGGPTEKEKGKEKTSSVYERNLARLGLVKSAEDAINPAQISAGPASAQGAAPPPGASPAQEGVPSEPADVNSQKRLIDSNMAAINYTKGQAKADPKKDVNKVLDEPALSAAHDSTLNKTLDETSQAGVKISHDLTKTAAAQALLYKLAEEACGEKNKGKKKEKQSQMAGLSNPSGQSGFSATSMGM